MQQSRDSPNLDLLRSVAVLAVLSDHIAGTFGIAQKHPFFWALGRWGVLLFFVHTSLVLMMSMGRLGLGWFQLHITFYIRRFFRIYPLSILVVATVLVAQIPRNTWSGAFKHPELATIISNFLLCQNLVLKPPLIGPLWSLPYEIQMYLLLPVLFLFVRKSSASALGGLWLGSIVLGVVQPWLAGTNHGRLLGIDRLGIAEFIPCFLAGVIAYFILSRKSQPRLPFWVWVSTLGVVAVAYLEWNARVGYVGYPEWICCLVVGLIVVRCVESKHHTLNFLTHHIAKYSYGLYLGQVPILWVAFVKLNHLPLSLQWIFFLLLLFAVPIASYHLVEHPFVKLGTALSARKVTAIDEKPSVSAT